MIKRSLVIGSLFVSLLANAQPYLFEVDGSYVKSENDFSETEVTALGATYYWQGVDAPSAPYAEAPFVARSSSVRLSYENSSVDRSPVFIQQGVSPIIFEELPIATLPIATGDTPIVFGGASAIPDPGLSIDRLRLATRYVSPTGWIGELSYSFAEDDRSVNSGSFSTTFDSEDTTLTLAAGYYVANNTTIAIEYQDSSSENEFSSTFMFTPPGGGIIFPIFRDQSTRSVAESSVNGVSLKGKTLLQQGNQHHAVSITLGYDQLDFDSTFIVTVPVDSQNSFSDKSYAVRSAIDYVYYPRPDLGFGLSYNVADAEFTKSKALELNAKWFVTPQISLRLNYINLDVGFSAADEDGFGIGVAARF